MEFNTGFSFGFKPDSDGDLKEGGHSRHENGTGHQGGYDVGELWALGCADQAAYCHYGGDTSRYGVDELLWRGVVICWGRG